MNLNLVWMVDIFRDNLVSIPIRDLMNLNHYLVIHPTGDIECVSIPIRDLMNLNRYLYLFTSRRYSFNPY